MEESLKLKEYTDKLDKVMKYNDGDMTRAKQVVQGILQDFMVIKGKMLSEQSSESGIFLLFIHRFKHYLVDKVSIIKDNKEFVANILPTDPWRDFFAEIENSLTTQDYLKDKVTKLNQEWEKEFRPAILSQMLEKLQNKDLTSATIQLEKICSYAFGKGDFLLQMDFEEIPSYDYDDIVKSAFLKIEEKKREKEKPPVEAPVEKAPTTDEIELFRRKLASEGNVILKGDTSLSPIKGRFISEIRLGDVISGRIKDASQKAMNVVRQLSLITPEGRVRKTKGKVLFTKKSEQGYVIFVQIAPLVTLEILEEEEVKIECFTGIEPTKKKKSSVLPMIIISSIITAILVFFLIIMIAF